MTYPQTITDLEDAGYDAIQITCTQQHPSGKRHTVAQMISMPVLALAYVGTAEVLAGAASTIDRKLLQDTGAVIPTRQWYARPIRIRETLHNANPIT